MSGLIGRTEGKRGAYAAPSFVLKRLPTDFATQYLAETVREHGVRCRVTQHKEAHADRQAGREVYGLALTLVHGFSTASKLRMRPKKGG